MNNKQVDILLSVYNPNEEYLIKQLISLNNQTYPNLKLYILLAHDLQSNYKHGSLQSFRYNLNC